MKNKVKIFTDEVHGRGISLQIEYWQDKNPSVNIVSVDIMPGGIFGLNKATVVYNTGETP